MPRIDVYYDGPGAELNKIGLGIFNMWVAFALGQRRLGGRRLKQPTGVYASSIRREVLGKDHVAVIADTRIAPHARILETGHRAFDMLDYLTPGRAYPIRRTTFMPTPGAATRFNVNLQTGRRARAVSSGVVRAGQFAPSLVAIVRPPRSRNEVAGRLNTSRRGPAWTVPAMPAYAPARIIANLFSKRVADRGGTVGYTL